MPMTSTTQHFWECDRCGVKEEVDSPTPHSAPDGWYFIADRLIKHTDSDYADRGSFCGTCRHIIWRCLMGFVLDPEANPDPAAKDKPGRMKQ